MGLINSCLAVVILLKGLGGTHLHDARVRIGEVALGFRLGLV
jgi:hypothetical protein